MFRRLWQNRDRYPLGGREWCRSWAKRVITSPVLFEQLRIQARLRRGGTTLGENVFISSDKDINGKLKDLSIGSNSFVGRAQIAVHDSITIGNRVCINDGAMLLSASHDVGSPNWKLKVGKINVQDYAWIATCAIILPGVQIGRGAVVGAGAVVSKNVPDYAIAVGNPAVIRENARATNLDYNPIANLASFTAWQRILNHEARVKTEVK